MFLYVVVDTKINKNRMFLLFSTILVCVMSHKFKFASSYDYIVQNHSKDNIFQQEILPKIKPRLFMNIH